MIKYEWKPYDSGGCDFDIRAFPTPGLNFSKARITSDDSKVFKLCIPIKPGTYSTTTPIETPDDATVDDLKNLAAVLIAAQEQS